MPLVAGKMYRPTDVAVDIANDSVYVVEHFNHRISKWTYSPGATPPANFVFTLDAGQVTSITITDGGSGYTVADPVDISAPTLDIANPVNAIAEVATVAVGVISTLITLGGINTGYSNGEGITLSLGTGTGATATAVITTNSVQSVTLVSGGSDYTANDVLTITGVVSGSTNATIVVGAIIDGVIQSITVTNGGNGYDPTNLPTVTATTGGSGAILASVVSTPWGSNGDGTSGEGAPIGDGGPTDNALYRPTGIVFDGTRLVVTDTFHNRIRTLNVITGAFIDSVGKGGVDTDEFYRPAGIATNGIILVIADEFNHRAVKYFVGDTPDTPALLPNPTPLAFHSPHGVIFDVTISSFNVTDSIRSIINRYDNTAATFQGQFGTPGITGTDLFFPASGHGTLTGNASTAFADTRNNEIKTVALSTIANTTGTTAGTGDGELYYPESVNSFMDTASYVLAANTLNNRVEVYSNLVVALTFRDNFGSPN